MKRIFMLALALLLALSLAAPAFADVAYEPNNRFFQSHSGACRNEDRGYYSNGAVGCALVYDAPDGKAAAALPNGVIYWIYYTYDSDGILWGQLDYDPDDPGNRDNWRNYVSGWVQMDDMTATYDYQAFYAEHKDEISPSERSLEIDPEETVYAYRYPGSGEVIDVLDGQYYSDEPIPTETEFTDDAGRTWGYIGYWRGWRHMWVCLDDPYNPALEPDENCRVPAVTPAASAEEMAAILKAAPSGTSNAYLSAGAAGVVIIAAAVLFVVLRRKKRT